MLHTKLQRSREKNYSQEETGENDEGEKDIEDNSELKDDEKEDNIEKIQEPVDISLGCCDRIDSTIIYEQKNLTAAGYVLSGAK